MRELLNFGHTFGHAIEAGLGFGTWLHGEAVGCGMVLGTKAARRLGLVSEAQARRDRAADRLGRACPSSRRRCPRIAGSS